MAERAFRNARSIAAEIDAGRVGPLLERHGLRLLAASGLRCPLRGGRAKVVRRGSRLRRKPGVHIR